MPLRNEFGDLVLVFSGDEIPAPETQRELKARGHVLDVDGPDYLVHLAEEDSDFPVALNGKFHGVLVDRKCAKATLFNDRYGMHRMYYSVSGEAFYFAVEAKAILAVRPECRRVDERGMGELVACGCVLENRTMFRDVHVLPCAASWVFRNGALEERKQYFEPREWEDQDPLPPATYYREIREVFARKLPQYFTGREPVGMSLTGGLDTRMVMAWQRQEPGSLPCYTFGGIFRDCADVRVARQVAGVCGQPHQVITVGPEFLRDFPHYAEQTVYATDGCAEVNRAPDLYLNQIAGRIAPVRMTGNYGGEILRHVRAFKPVEATSGLFRGDLLPLVRQAQDTYGGLVRGHALSFAVFRQSPWHHHGLLALEQTQVSLRSPFLDNDLIRTVFRAPATPSADQDVCLRLISDGRPALRVIPTDRGPIDGLLGPASRKWVEFMRKAEYAYDVGMPHWLVRIDRALNRFGLERLFLGRQKFAHFRVWYRGVLSRYVKEILLDRRSLSRSYLDRSAVEGLVSSHLDGRRNHTFEIHKLLTLELVHRLFVDA
jgi:asparagine synthase (glutamine-hydrolysing)